MSARRTVTTLFAFALLSAPALGQTEDGTTVAPGGEQEKYAVLGAEGIVDELQNVRASVEIMRQSLEQQSSIVTLEYPGGRYEFGAFALTVDENARHLRLFAYRGGPHPAMINECRLPSGDPGRRPAGDCLDLANEVCRLHDAFFVSRSIGVGSFKDEPDARIVCVRL